MISYLVTAFVVTFLLSSLSISIQVWDHKQFKKRYKIFDIAKILFLTSIALMSVYYISKLLSL